MAPAQSTLRDNIRSPSGTLRSPGGKSIRDTILNLAAANSTNSSVQVRVLSPLRRASPSKRTSKHKRVTPSVTTTLRFNEEEPESPERTTERLLATQTESPEVNATETIDAEVGLVVVDEVEIAVNAALPLFKRLDPLRAAKAAIRAAKISQERNSKARGKRTKECVEAHMRQQLSVGCGMKKGTARPGTQLLIMNNNVNMFAYRKQNTAEPSDCKDSGKANLSLALSKLKRALKPCVSPEHQCYLLHHYVTKDENQSIGMTLGVLKCPDKDHGTADVIADNLKQYFAEMKGKSSNDIIGARNTVLFSLSSPAPDESASDGEKKVYATSLKNLSDRL